MRFVSGVVDREAFGDANKKESRFLFEIFLVVRLAFKFVFSGKVKFKSQSVVKAKKLEQLTIFLTDASVVESESSKTFLIETYIEIEASCFLYPFDEGTLIL